MKRPKVYVTRKLEFCAAHRLHNPAWSDEQNREVFGLCNSPNWHGHNYILYVTLAGPPDPQTGYLMDLGKLKKLVNEHVVQQLDHRNLNLDVDFLQGEITSTENLAVAIWNQLLPKLPESVELHAIKLYETPRNMVEYRGEVVDVPDTPEAGQPGAMEPALQSI